MDIILQGLLPWFATTNARAPHHMQPQPQSKGYFACTTNAPRQITPRGQPAPPVPPPAAPMHLATNLSGHNTPHKFTHDMMEDAAPWSHAQLPADAPRSPLAPQLTTGPAALQPSSLQLPPKQPTQPRNPAGEAHLFNMAILHLLNKRPQGPATESTPTTACARVSKCLFG